MLRQSARSAVIVLLSVTVPGCYPVDLTGLTFFGQAPLCATPAECGRVSLTRVTPVMLFGDTAGFTATTEGNFTDIQWEFGTPAVSLVATPVIVPLFSGRGSHIVVRRCRGLSAGDSASRELHFIHLAGRDPAERVTGPRHHPCVPGETGKETGNCRTYCRTFSRQPFFSCSFVDSRARINEDASNRAFAAIADNNAARKKPAVKTSAGVSF